MNDVRNSLLGNSVGLLLVAVLLFAAIGCGSSQNPDWLPVYPVTGKVVFKGTAPAGAFVVLHPKGGAAAANGETVRPRGKVGADGTFALTSYCTNDGAPVGDYAVTVELRQLIQYPNGEVGPGPNVVPKVYSKPETSPLSVQIATGRNELPPFELKEAVAVKQTAVRRNASNVRGM